MLKIIIHNKVTKSNIFKTFSYVSAIVNNIGWFWNCSLSQNLSNLTYQWRWVKPKVHRRSICMPRNCDFSNWNRGSQGVIFSLIVSRLLIWFLSLSPSLGLEFCPLPNFSIAIGVCKKELPGIKRKKTHCLILTKVFFCILIRICIRQALKNYLFLLGRLHTEISVVRNNVFSSLFH